MTKAVNETLIERRKPRGPRDERERERLSETLIERREERYREVKKRERERAREVFLEFHQQSCSLATTPTLTKKN